MILRQNCLFLFKNIIYSETYFNVHPNTRAASIKEQYFPHRHNVYFTPMRVAPAPHSRHFIESYLNFQKV